MRYRLSLALAAALQVPAVVYAQQVSVAGWVNRVDTANSTITIRTLANPRTIQVAPNAVVLVNGRVSQLGQIPANSAVSITTERGPTGVLTATQISARSTGPQPSAAAPPGSTVQGVLVGVNIPDNAVTVRTLSGDHVIPLGTAPILVNGVQGSIRDFRLGQTIQIRRALPTEASTELVTQRVWVTPSPSQVATYRTAAGGTTRRAVVRSRTAAYRTTYRSRSSTTRRHSRRSHRRVRSHKRRHAMQSNVGARAAAALTGTAPASAMVTSGAGTVIVTPAPASPGAVVVAPGAVTPGVVYVAPVGADVTVPPVIAAPAGTAPVGIIGVGPATIAPDSRLQSGAAAPGTPDARNQSGATGAAVPSGVGSPNNQSIAPNAAVGAGAVPAPGVPDPRFQSFGPNAVTGVTVPGAPGVVPRPVAPSGFGSPGFVGPRVIAPRPMVTPRVVVPPAAPR